MTNPLRELSDSDLPFELIDRAEAFEEVLPYLQGAELLAVDTESDGYYSYRERVCLIQFSTDEIDMILDPLADLPLQELAPIFANPAQIKIFHDAEFDIAMLKGDFGFEFRSLFDTRIALSMLGSDRPGLGNVIRDRFGVELDKSLQRSNWRARPLSEEQLAYARSDTIFLIDLYHELLAELEEGGRARGHAAECRKLERLEPREKVFDPGAWSRIKGWQALSPRGRRYLHDLYAWRERVAEREDVAPFRILHNHALLGIARRAGQGAGQHRGALALLKPRQRSALGASLLEALEESRSRPPLSSPPGSAVARSRRRSLSSREQAVYEDLREWRKRRAAQDEMNAAYVLPKECLSRLVASRPRTLEELARVPDLAAWQVEEYGEEILEILAGLPGN